MATTKRTRRKPFLDATERRATLCYHVLDGIPDEKLRAVAGLPAGERLRGLMSDASTRETGSPRRAEADSSVAIERAQARIDILLRSLSAAKPEADPVPLSAADAAALFDVAFAAGEDLSDLLIAQRDGGKGA